MGVWKNLQDDFGGDLLTAFTHATNGLAVNGGGRLDVNGSFTTTELDLDPDLVTGDVELVGIGGPGHALITGPVDDTLLVVASNPVYGVRLKGITLQGPTTGTLQATIVASATKSIELEDCVLRGGTHGCFLVNPGTLRLDLRKVRFKDVLGNASRLNPIGLWLFNGGGSEYTYIDAEFDTVHGSGLVLDAGSNEAGPHTMVKNFQIPRIKFKDVATAVGAAAVIDCQSAGPGLFGQVLIDGGGGNGAAGLVLKNDQYYGETGITKTTGISVSQLRIRGFAGHYVYFDSVEGNHIGHYQAEACPATFMVANYAATRPSPLLAGGATDWGCKANVIDYLDWRLAPDTAGVNFNAAGVEVCESNVIRYATPDLLPVTYGGTASRSGRSKNRVRAA